MLPVLAIPVAIVGLIGSLLLGSMGVSNLQTQWYPVNYKHSMLSVEGKDIDELRRDYRWYTTVLHKQIVRNKAPKEYAQIEKITKKIEKATTKEQFTEIEKLIDKIGKELEEAD